MPEKMSNAEWEYTFEPMIDLEDRWGLTPEEAEVFLEAVGYFDTQRYHEVAEVFDPTPPERHQ